VSVVTIDKHRRETITFAKAVKKKYIITRRQYANKIRISKITETKNNEKKTEIVLVYITKNSERKDD